MAVINCNVEDRVKAEAKAAYAAWGIDLTTAINVFLRKSIECQGFPFEVRPSRLNSETIAAMIEAERIANDPSVRFYTSVQDFLSDLKGDKTDV